MTAQHRAGITMQAAPLPPSKARLFSLAFAVLLPALGVSIVNVALPALASDFMSALTTVNWVVISYLIALATFVLGAGVLGDSFGRKRLLMLGIGIFTGAAVLGALSVNVTMLVLARLLQGVGASFILSQAYALASVQLPAGRTGKALGLLSSTTAMGTALGPAAGGVLLDSQGWQAVFWLMALLGGISLAWCGKSVAMDVVEPRPAAQRFDLLGTLLLALCCLCYAMAMTEQKLPLNIPAPLYLVPAPLYLVAALMLLMLFLQSQRNRAFALIDLAFFRHQLRNWSLVVAFVVDAVAMSTLVIGPFYLSYALALSPLAVGLLLAVGPLASACAGYPAGKLVDRFGVNKVMLTGLALMSAGVLCFGWLPVQFGVSGYVAALLLMTPGRQLFLTANSTFVLQSAAAQQKGLASGLLHLTKNLGLMTGAAAIAGFFSARLPQQDVAQASVQALSAAFGSTFTLAGCALGVTLFSLALALWRSR